MSGVVAGLIGSVKAAAATPTNLVTNPSFTDASLADWESIDYAPFSRVTEGFRTAPACLNYDQGDGNANVQYNKLSTLTVGSRYSLSLWIKTVNTQNFTIGLRAGTNLVELVTAEQSLSAPYTNYKIENVLCEGNGQLYISVSSYYNAYLDDVSVVQGATALVL